MPNLQKARPIANWQNRDEYDIKPEDFYDADTLASHPTAGEKALLQNMIWRWEFLRRHPEYQTNWKEAEENWQLANMLYGLSTVGLDPFDPDKRAPIIFSDMGETAKPWLISCTVDLRYPIKPQLPLINAHYGRAKGLIAKTMSKEKFNKEYRKKWPNKSKIIKALRVLDAYAEGISYAQIAKTLGAAADKAHMSQYGKEYVENAFAIQHYFTRRIRYQGHRLDGRVMHAFHLRLVGDMDRRVTKRRPRASRLERIAIIRARNEEARSSPVNFGQ